MREFLSKPFDPLLESLAAHHRRLLGFEPSGNQQSVWAAEHTAMSSALRDCCLARPEAVNWGIVFEYELPLEGGRRPDVVVLAGETVVVLEFKSSPVVDQAFIDQIDAYARDLADYHEGSHARRVLPILILGDQDNDIAELHGDTIVCGQAGLGHYLAHEATEGVIDLDKWLRSSYSPLPTLVSAARRI